MKYYIQPSLYYDADGQLAALLHGVRKLSEERLEEEVEQPLQDVWRVRLRALHRLFPEQLQCSPPHGAVLVQQAVDIPLQFLHGDNERTETYTWLDINLGDT